MEDKKINNDQNNAKQKIRRDEAYTPSANPSTKQNPSKDKKTK